MKGLVELVEGVIVCSINRCLSKRSRVGNIPKPGLQIGTTLSFGVSPEGEPVMLTESERRRHLYLLGATGCGKTNLLLQLIEDDVRTGRTICILDLRGDLVNRVLATNCGSLDPSRVMFIDLGQDEHVVGFNPLSGTGDIHARAFQVLGVIQRQADSWGVQLEETLRNCLVALAEAGLTMVEIEPLLTNRAFRHKTLAKVSDPAAKAFFARYDALSDERQATWSLPVLNKVTPFIAIPRLRRLFGSSSTIKISEILSQPGKVILVSLAVDKLHGAAYLVGALLISAIQNAMMSRVDLEEGKRNRVNLYVDEFETMACDAFESIIAEGRRFGLSLTLAHQNLSQIQPKLKQLLQNNVQTRFFFQTGAIDASELASEISSSSSKEQVKSQLMGQRVGEAFLLRRGVEAVRLQTAPIDDVRVRRECTEDFKRAVVSQYGQSPNGVDQLIDDRLGQGSTLEVRHSKKPRLD